MGDEEMTKASEKRKNCEDESTQSSNNSNDKNIFKKRQTTINKC